jgi:hypothetical protein
MVWISEKHKRSDSMKKEDTRFFNRRLEFSVVDRNLPHWIQDGALCFVNWRAADSLPAFALVQLDAEINEILTKFKIDSSTNWKRELQKQSARRRANIYRKLFLIRDKFLDKGYGRCLLANKECAIEVESSLLFFDEERYFVTDLVVMPNHVHYIAAFRDEESFLKQNADLKRFTARTINRICGVKGKFWQVDQFDHLIRHQGAFDYYRQYIQKNPTEAGLSEDRFRHFSKKS